MEISEPQAAVQNREVAEELLELLRSLNEKLAGKMLQSRSDPQRRPASKVQGMSRSFHLMEMKWAVERITQVYFIGTRTHTQVKDLFGRSHRVVHLRNGY